MMCGCSGRFLLTWSQSKSCQVVFTVVKALENKVQPVIGMGVDHDALWVT